MTVTIKEYYKLPGQRQKTDEVFLKQIKYLETVKRVVMGILIILMTLGKHSIPQQNINMFSCLDSNFGL